MKPDPRLVAASMDTSLRTLAPSTVQVGARPIDNADIEELIGAERETISRMVPVRRAEFASGRALLRRLTGMAVAMPMGPDRAPVLPSSFRGSIAHDRSLVVGAVSSSLMVEAIGIDVEPVVDLDADVRQVILRDDEKLDPLVGFVTKEAVYKAWHSLGGSMLEHRDVHVDLVGGGDTFVATILDREVVTGRYTHSCGRVIALVVVGRDGGAWAE